MVLDLFLFHTVISKLNSIQIFQSIDSQTSEALLTVQYIRCDVGKVIENRMRSEIFFFL